MRELRGAMVNGSGVDWREYRTPTRTAQSTVFAKNLLLNTMSTLAEIAPQAGFGTVQYMATVFCRSIRQTPGQFRQSHQRQRR
jgi:transcriptional regulator GlxA family with amidase domain